MNSFDKLKVLPNSHDWRYREPYAAQHRAKPELKTVVFRGRAVVPRQRTAAVPLYERSVYIAAKPPSRFRQEARIWLRCGMIVAVLTGIPVLFETAQHNTSPPPAEAQTMSMDLDTKLGLEAQARWRVAHGQAIRYLEGGKQLLGFCVMRPMVMDGHWMAVYPAGESTPGEPAQPHVYVGDTVNGAEQSKTQQAILIPEPERQRYVGPDPSSGKHITIGMPFPMPVDGNCNHLPQD